MSLSKSRITRVKLIDGKTIHYPSDIEIKQLGNEILEVHVEERMTKEEFDKKYTIEPPKREHPYWECSCGAMHSADYICTMLAR